MASALGGALGALGIGSALEGTGSAIGGFFMGIGTAASGLFQGLGEAAKAPDGAVRVKSKTRDVEFNPVSLSMSAVGVVAAYGLYRAVDRWIVPGNGVGFALPKLPPLIPELPKPNTNEAIALNLRSGFGPIGTSTSSRNDFTPGRDKVSTKDDAVNRLLARSGSKSGDGKKRTVNLADLQTGRGIYTVSGRLQSPADVAQRIKSGPGNVDSNIELIVQGGISRARLRREGILG